MARRFPPLLDAVFVGGLAVFVVFQLTVGRFAQMDESFFKAAGREWAATGYFRAPEIRGFLRVDPPPEEIWFAQPPLYPFLFGAAVLILGFGPTSCILYDALIHATLAFLTYRLARQKATGLPPVAAFLAGLAVLPVGTLARPDELAMCIALVGLMLINRDPVRLRDAVLSGGCFGLAAGTSSGAALLLGMTALVLLALGDDLWPAKARRALAWGLAAAVVLAAVIAPILIAHPNAWRQYLEHSRHHIGMDPQSYETAWRMGKTYLLPTAGFLIVAVLTLGAKPEDLSRMTWLRWWLGPLCGIVYLALLMPKYLYTWFLGPWMLVGTIVTLPALDSRPWLARTALLAAGLGYAAAASSMVKSTFILLQLPPEQRLTANADAVRRLVPVDSTVLTEDWWWTLGNSRRVYDPYFVSLPDAELEKVDYVIRMPSPSGKAGELNGMTSDLTAYVKKHFVPIHDNLVRENAAVLGWRMPDSAFGFGMIVLRRAEPAPEPRQAENRERE